MHNIARHHQHLRKRLYENLEPYPHPDFVKRFLDRVIFLVGFLAPAFTLPQIYQIYVVGDATGVSTITFAGYTFFSAIWVTYGIVHKERAVLVANSCWFIVNGAVTLGTLLH